MSEEFIGAAELKHLQAKQLHQFEEWAAAGDWDSFHRSHYDWWAFPVDAPSAHGFKYTLTSDAIETLRRDRDFLDNLRSAAVLLLRSWGWDVTQGKPVEAPRASQVWQHWPVRLYKCTRSLEIFEQWDLFNACRDYALSLVNLGHDFNWNGRDLRHYFEAH